MPARARFASVSDNQDGNGFRQPSHCGAVSLKTMRTIMHTFASCVDDTAVPKFGGIVWAGKFGLKASNDSKKRCQGNTMVEILRRKVS